MNTTQPATPAEKIIIKDMLNELVNNALVVVLLPAPEQRHTGHMVRAVEQQNANWYREFCADHEEYRSGYEKPKTIIKRQETISALYRVLDGDCTTVYAQRLLEHVRAAFPHPMAQPATQQEQATMNYHDKKTSTANLAHAFLSNNWELVGYKENQSDSMTDYYDPAYWSGTATHPDYPGYMVVVDCGPYNAKNDCGRRVYKNVVTPNGICPRCHGKEYDPSGWTLEAARVTPELFNEFLIDIEHGENSGIVNLMPSVVSPHPFRGNALTCRTCKGSGTTTQTDKVIDYDWPIFQANKKGMMWHIEKEGEIIKSGKGYKRLGTYIRSGGTNGPALQLYGEIVNHMSDNSSTPPSGTNGGSNPRVKLTATLDTKQAKKFRTLADNMIKTIDDKLNPATGDLNPTPRRVRIAQGMREDGYALQEVQTVLYNLADMYDAGTIEERHTIFTSKKSLITAQWSRDENNELFNELLGEQPEVDKTAELIREKTIEARFSKIDGYFPTPTAVIDQMLEYVDIDATTKALEPSAGSGNIAEVMSFNGAHVDTCETSYSLREILELKGYTVSGYDFMEYTQGGYDVIMMNPPFENKQDMKHVRHAYSLLAPGGVLVSIMAAGFTFRADAQNFRNWLDDQDSEYYKLPDGSFKESGTNVNAYLVVIRNNETPAPAPAAELAPAAQTPAPVELVHAQIVPGELEPLPGEPTIKEPAPVELAPAQTGTQTRHGLNYEIKVDGTWTWLHFDSIPAEDVRSTLKDVYGAVFSGKRVAWYIRQQVDQTQLIAAL